MNLGALLRTALAVGVHAVITPKDRCAPPTPVVSSASAGALEHVRLVQAVNLVRTLEALKEKNFWIFGLDHRARQDCFQTDFTGPSVLVIGGEGKGIRPLVKKTCDHLVSIPQQGPVSSLNASVAGAVVMYADEKGVRGAVYGRKAGKFFGLLPPGEWSYVGTLGVTYKGVLEGGAAVAYSWS
jgi:23S rRNA (guanosine2251-2'-O)-methyltransferase